jgi:hypothetical protein
MPTPNPTLSMLRDALVVAVIAVLTVQGLRRFYGDRYLVPSDSMQPVLYGDPVDGDVVFVDKCADRLARRRGDLVVVENPYRTGHQLVKRIAASGDEEGKTCINIINGDIWLGDSPQHMQIEQKEPRDAMKRSVTWAEAEGAARSTATLDLRAASGDGPWNLPPLSPSIARIRSTYTKRSHHARHMREEGGVLPVGVVGTSKPVDASFVDLTGERSESGGSVSVTDCGLELKFEEHPEVLLCSIDSSDFTTTFVWTNSSNSMSIWVNGKSILQKTGVLRAAWRGQITFGRLDGRDFVMLDDDFTLPIKTPLKATSPMPKTWLHVGVVGEVSASIASLRVFRDVFSYRQPELSVGASGWPRRIDAGHWFLLGDNAFDSRDSRQIGAIPTSKFLGIPTHVIGPPSRARRLGP